MSAARATWVRRLGIAAAVAAALAWVPYHLYSSSGLARYLKLKSERDALHQANLRVLEDNQRLRAELAAITDDEDDPGRALAAIERAARDELGLVRPGEVVFQIEAPRPGEKAR